eukprot:scaffold30891_cov30-Tisochrysis_lutea.AAC.2
MVGEDVLRVPLRRRTRGASHNRRKGGRKLKEALEGETGGERGERGDGGRADRDGARTRRESGRDAR